MRILLGDRARDKISGFEGIVVARTKWLRGCDRLSIQPTTLHDGRPVESVSFDEPDVEFIEHTDLTQYASLDQAATAEKRPRTTGGPRPEPRRHR